MCEPELLLHTNVRWLSRSKFLQRFRDVLDEIRIFLENRNEDFKQLNDEDWLCDFAFLADFTGTSILRVLNLKLQGKSKTISEMISILSAFKKQIPSLIHDLQEQTFHYFPNVKDHLQIYPGFIWSSEKYVSKINSVMNDFDI